MSYTDSVSPREFSEAVNRGYERLKNFRGSRLYFIKNYVGAYYDRQSMEVGTEALNLIFNAVRILVPNIVLSFPKHTIVTPYIQAKEYAELLSLALSQHDKQINIRDTYRRVIIDAIFTLGIMKTGLAQSKSVYALDDEDQVDAGTIYTEAVDFDNFTVDPNCKEHLFRDAMFVGDRITLPRRMLLESGLYKNDLVEQLPRAGDVQYDDKASDVSMRRIIATENYELEDEVEIVEAYVPSANAIVTVPGSKNITFDDYLRVDDFYGVKEGPYTYLALTPPVPGNPLPIPSVGIWNDLHILANRMAKKIAEQAERQKDIVAYRGSAADDAEELRNAGDGETIKVDDPDAIRTLSFGGQENKNEVHLAQLQMWFNQMAGNPAQMGGQDVPARSATAATIMQSNAGIGLEDMKDLVYQAAASEARKRGWYLHTDPLMNIPIAKRQQTPPQYVNGPLGPVMVVPPMLQDVQVILTPEARRGEYMDYFFTIEPESMGRRDSKTRFAQALDFATKIVPSVSAAAQQMVMLGIPFSAKAFIMRMAEDAGITWLDEVFYDPEFQMQMMQQMALGPQIGPSKGTAAPSTNPQAIQNAMMQNGTIGNTPQNPPPDMQQRQDQQSGANFGQQILRRDVLSGLRAPEQIPAFG